MCRTNPTKNTKIRLLHVFPCSFMSKFQTWISSLIQLNRYLYMQIIRNLINDINVRTLCPWNCEMIYYVQNVLFIRHTYMVSKKSHRKRNFINDTRSMICRNIKHAFLCFFVFHAHLMLRSLLHN